MKKPYIIGSILCVVGLVIFSLAFAASGWDISKLNTQPTYEQNEYTSHTDLHSIVVEDQDQTILLDRSEDDAVHIIYYENEKETYEISENGTLRIQRRTHYKWYDSIFNINMQNNVLTILIPAQYAGTITAETSNGDITAENISADTLDAVTANGDITVTNLNANNSITAQGSNGSITVHNIAVGNALHLQTSNGDINGDILGNMDDFSIRSQTSNGDNNLPEHTSGGNKQLQVQTENGTIEIHFFA